MNSYSILAIETAARRRFAGGPSARSARPDVAAGPEPIWQAADLKRLIKILKKLQKYNKTNFFKVK